MSLVTPSHQAGDMTVLMDLLADPTKLQARLDQLKRAEDSAKEQIALAGSASEIVQLRAEIEQLHQQAKDAVANAQVEGEAIITEANQEAANVVADAEAEASQIKQAAEDEKQRADTMLSDARAEATAVSRDRNALSARTTQCDQHEKQLQQRADALDIQEQELTEEKSKLARVRELISQVV